MNQPDSSQLIFLIWSFICGGMFGFSAKQLFFPSQGEAITAKDAADRTKNVADYFHSASVEASKDNARNKDEHQGFTSNIKLTGILRILNEHGEAACLKLNLCHFYLGMLAGCIFLTFGLLRKSSHESICNDSNIGEQDFLTGGDYFGGGCLFFHVTPLEKIEGVKSTEGSAA